MEISSTNNVINKVKLTMQIYTIRKLLVLHLNQLKQQSVFCSFLINTCNTWLSSGFKLNYKTLWY